MLRRTVFIVATVLIAVAVFPAAADAAGSCGGTSTAQFDAQLRGQHGKLSSVTIDNPCTGYVSVSWGTKKQTPDGYSGTVLVVEPGTHVGWKKADLKRLGLPVDYTWQGSGGADSQIHDFDPLHPDFLVHADGSLQVWPGRQPYQVNYSSACANDPEEKIPPGTWPELRAHLLVKKNTIVELSATNSCQTLWLMVYWARFPDGGPAQTPVLFVEPGASVNWDSKALARVAKQQGFTLRTDGTGADNTDHLPSDTHGGWFVHADGTVTAG